MALKHIIATALVFTAGTCYGRSSNSPAAIGEAYQERIRALESTAVLDILRARPTLLNTYLYEADSTERSRVAYISLAQQARAAGTSASKEAEKLEKQFGARWRIEYARTNP
jgi:hypothetical protein